MRWPTSAAPWAFTNVTDFVETITTSEDAGPRPKAQTSQWEHLVSGKRRPDDLASPWHQLEQAILIATRDGDTCPSSNHR
jgi:hypothetical protein